MAGALTRFFTQKGGFLQINDKYVSHLWNCVRSYAMVLEVMA
jgi:hypothetical protein